MKKIIRLTALLMILAICFSSLISCGECKHENQSRIIIPPTCSSQGYTKVVCIDCSDGYECVLDHVDYVDALPHTYDTTKCGTTQKCLYCDYTVAIKHEFEENQDGTYSTTCKNCKKMPFASLLIPTLPIDLTEKNASKTITDAYTITKIEPNVIKDFILDSFEYRLKLTVMRVYPNNLSGKATIAWKLYRNGTEVVRSGQEYSTTSIAKGESSTIIIEDIASCAWSDGYSLKFLNLIDS